MLTDDIKDFISTILIEHMLSPRELDVTPNTAFVKIEILESEEYEDADNINFTNDFDKALKALLDSKYFSNTYKLDTNEPNFHKVLLTYSANVQIER